MACPRGFTCGAWKFLYSDLAVRKEEAKFYIKVIKLWNCTNPKTTHMSKRCIKIILKSLEVKTS
jgi:hypothetical protein